MVRMADPVEIDASMNTHDDRDAIQKRARKGSISNYGAANEASWARTAYSLLPRQLMTAHGPFGTTYALGRAKRNGPHLIPGEVLDHFDV